MQQAPCLRPSRRHLPGPVGADATEKPPRPVRRIDALRLLGIGQLLPLLDAHGEIEQILELIRLLNAGYPERFAKQYPVFLEHGASFSFEALAQVREFPQLLQVLERTPYAKALEPFQPEEAGQSIDYTGCETALYADYYRRLEQTVDQLFRGRVRSQLQELIETHVELINIRTIYRMKTFFPDAEPDRIRRLLLPSWRRISAAELEQFLSAPTAGSSARH